MSTTHIKQKVENSVENLGALECICHFKLKCNSSSKAVSIHAITRTFAWNLVTKGRQADPIPRHIQDIYDTNIYDTPVYDTNILNIMRCPLEQAVFCSKNILNSKIVCT